MPVVHEYNDEYGMYIRSNIDGDFITLQLTPSASKFLEELNYHGGEKVTWGLIRPLWENDYAYTQGDHSVPTEGSDVQVDFEDAPAITDWEEQRLKEFLEPTTPPQGETNEVPEDVLSHLRGWIDEDLTQDRAHEFLSGADDTEGSIRSIRRFAEYSVSVSQLELSQGAPGYTLTLGDDQLRCIDLRWSQSSDEFIITVNSDAGNPQSLKISNGRLRVWQYHGESPSGVTHIREFLAHLPAIARLSEWIDDYDIKLTSWDISQATTFNISDELKDRIETEIELLSGTEVASPRQDCTGEVEAIHQVGHSIVREEQTGHRLPFESASPDIDKLNPGDKISFDVETVAGLKKAVSIRREKQPEISTIETDLPDDVVEFVSRTTDSPERTIARLSLIIQFDISVDSLTRSVRTFQSLEHTIQEFSIDESGHPVYSLEMPDKDGVWRVTHHLTPTDVDFDIELRPQREPNQATQIADGKFVYWRLNPTRDQNLEQQRHDFIRAQPNYLRLVTDVFDSIDWYTLDE